MKPARVPCGCPGPYSVAGVSTLKITLFFHRKSDPLGFFICGVRLSVCGVLPLQFRFQACVRTTCAPRCSPCLAYTDATRKESGAAPREGTGNQNPITPVDAMEAGGEEIVLDATGD